MDKYEFDHALAFECARSFSVSTGLGCTVSDISGKILYSCGCSVGNCPLADTTGISHADCIRAHNYGMTEAERFGGKYIYFCPLGLTCFVSPIIGEEGSMAKITVGPFLMVELQDFIDCELTENLHLEDAQKEQGKRYIDAGADVVVGAHTHCMQGIGYYKGKPIFYSLGNFWFNEKTLYTTILQLDIAENGEIKASMMPCLQSDKETRLLTKAKEKKKFIRHINRISTNGKLNAKGEVVQRKG